MKAYLGWKWVPGLCTLEDNRTWSEGEAKSVFGYLRWGSSSCGDLEGEYTLSDEGYFFNKVMDQDI